MPPKVEALVKKIGDQGDKVRQLKSSGADKVYTGNVCNSVSIFVKLFISYNCIASEPLLIKGI